MKKAVAFSCPSKSCHCGLVRNADQENIKMVLERVNMLSVHGSQRIWQQVEQDGPLTPKELFLAFLTDAGDLCILTQSCLFNTLYICV